MSTEVYRSETQQSALQTLGLSVWNGFRIVGSCVRREETSDFLNEG